MSTYSIKLKNTIESYNHNVQAYGYGFVFNYKDSSYIISISHFLPIIKTELDINSEIVELRKNKNIYWNEVAIYNSPDNKFLLNTKPIKNYLKRCIEKNTILKMEINNNVEKYYYYDTSVFTHPISRIRIVYMRFLIGEFNKNSDFKVLQNKYQGLSGSPVLNIYNQLIGIFSKIVFDKSNDDIISVYGYILPSIYIIKSLEKKNNESYFQINLDLFENLKIGNSLIKKDKDNNYSIYYSQLRINIPLDIYFSIEGDDNKKINSLDTKRKIEKELEFVKYDYFDYSYNLIKNDKNQYKLNTGLISILLKSRYQSQIINIDNNYKIHDKLNKNVWIDNPFC